MIKEKEHWNSIPESELAHEACSANILGECLNQIEPYLKPGRIFDLGCGVGRLIGPLSTRHPESNFVGIDFSENMLSIAPLKANVKYRINDGKTIPAHNDYFDFGYSMLVFQHVPKDIFFGYLKEAARVLKKGGIFRFQFVNGTQQHFLSHHALEEDVVKWSLLWFRHVMNVDRSVIYDNWTWMTLIK